MVGQLRPASLDSRVEMLFRPPLAKMTALSPDGSHVAYTVPAGSGLRIVILDLEGSDRKRSLRVDRDREAQTAADQPPQQLRFLRWATNSRLVFAPAPIVRPLPPVLDENGRAVPNPDGPTVVSPILAMDADGKQRGTLVDARDFMETSAEAQTLADLLRTPRELAASRPRAEPVRWRMPQLDILGFVPNDREQLVVQTRGGFSPPAQYAVDVRRGEVRSFAGNWALPPSAPEIFDWYRQKVVGERKAATHPTTVWRDEELGGLQRQLDAKFPRRVVEILDWSETRACVLFRVTGGSDPGRLFVFQRPEDLVVEILKRAPWLNAAKLNETRRFTLAAPDGAPLSLNVTWPRAPRSRLLPLVLMFPVEFSGRMQPGFDPEAEILADLGCVVARLHPRETAGGGVQDRNALRAGVDRVSVDDAVAAIEWLAARNPGPSFDRNQVVALGHGIGGYLALRALQLRPAVFCRGIAFDAPMDLRPRLNSPGKAGAATPVRLEDSNQPTPLADPNWNNLSVLDQAAALTNPVLLFVEPGRNPAIDTTTDALRTQLHDLGRPPRHLHLDAGFAAGRPASRATVYRRIAEFLNLRPSDEAGKPGAVKEGE